MLSKVIEKLSRQLTDGLADITAKKLSAEKRLSAALQLIRSLLHLLREQVLLHPFQDKPDEIHVFKNIKPRFLAAKIFELERYNLEQSAPAGTQEKLIAFYESELDIIRRFFMRYAFLYQYYRSGLTELDELYFIRGAEVPTVLMPEFGEPDPDFSTCGDYLFAKLQAFETLQAYIAERIAGLTAFSGQPGRLSKPFRWTGEVVNLIELGHAVYLNEQINNGELGIVEFFEGLGEFFGVNLGIPKKGFDDLKKRKRLSKTHFTDRMRDALVRKMDDEDALDKNRALKKKTGF
ncbi:RteC protein [Mucilaginibacter gracilis]|uniref:RteC protein n=1 Tax=Mucilaginibacter gracilis TaxID=423350 RepID=A0A495J8D6_9SPHI|nr:RteC domain-containing protein [Mucilaginibacter gracilis]RKR84289.1 RteC protein [Mucilaginibacter gracilis]